MIIGYTSGVYDLFHIGHLNLLRNAKGLCDKLIVGVSTDELILEYKKKKPIIPFQERMEIIRAIKYVDAVIPQENMDKLSVWKKLQFNIMFVGDDWYDSDKWNELDAIFKSNGVRISYFPYTKGTSSTLINEILEKERKNS